jgi:hypothetical protein
MRGFAAARVFSMAGFAGLVFITGFNGQIVRK